MTKTETFQVRFTPEELDLLRDYSTARGWSMAHALRELVRCLAGRTSRSVAITGDVELTVPAEPLEAAPDSAPSAGLKRPQDQPLEAQLGLDGLTGVDRVGRLPAYRVGAGTSSNKETESDLPLPCSTSQPEKTGSLQVEVGCSSKVSSPRNCVGEGVGKGCGETPREPLKRVNELEIPEWLEQYREYIMSWLENRKRKHRLKPALSPLTMKALEYAKELGILEQFCEVISERNWQSLGFVGHRETIERLAEEHGVLRKKSDRFTKPVMSPIKYTLG